MDKDLIRYICCLVAIMIVYIVYIISFCHLDISKLKDEEMDKISNKPILTIIAILIITIFYSLR